MVILALLMPVIMLIVTIAVVIVTRRARAGWRDVARVAWNVVIVAMGVGTILFANRLHRLQPETNPLVLGGIHISAIVQFCEAYFVSSLVWLPRTFDRLEATTGVMFIAVRQLRARKSGFLTVISFLAFLGVGLSSCALCTTTSIMGGFGNDLKRKILGNNAHVVMDRERGGFENWHPILDRVRRIPGVSTATPLVQGEVMVTSQTNLSGVILRGIDPDGGGSSASIRRELVRGRIEYLTQPERLLSLTSAERRPVTSRDSDEPQHALPPLGPPVPPVHELPPGVAPIPRFSGIGSEVLPAIIIGRELATNLHLAVGDEVRVVSPFGGMVTPAGPLPKTRLFRVAGVFYSGMYEYDTKYAFVTIPVAQNFFNYSGDQISSIEIRVRDVDSADAIAEAVQPIAATAHLRVRDWKQLNQNLFRALRLEKLMMFVLLGVAIVVASFAIVATLLLLVIEKGREIAVLKAMGASDGFIARVFVFIGLMIGIVGSTLGVSTALLVCSLVQKLGIPLDPEVYYIDRLPVFINPPDYLFVMLIAIMVCLVATLYPAWAASRLRPVDGMRFG